MVRITFPMSEQNILSRVIGSKERFGVKCAKYADAITVEALKDALSSEGINTSSRDVFKHVNVAKNAPV